MRARRPDVIFLFETLSFGVRLEALRVRLNFDSCFSIDVVGRSGGLAVLWNNNTHLSISSFSNNHIDMLANDPEGLWRITGYYGFPDRGRRHLSWQLLRQLLAAHSCPWMCIGDFNDLLTSSDKRGRVEHPQWLFRGFRDAINDCQLHDVPLSWYPYTWFRGQDPATSVEQRLDRAMGTPTWHSRFSRATLTNLVAPTSDHNPILLDTSPVAIRRRRRDFKFENRWLYEGEFKTVVRRSWGGFHDLDFLTRLNATGETLMLWGNKADAKFRVEKLELENVIGNLQGDFSSHGRAAYREAKCALGRLLVQEETFWRQRAKIFWLRDGDVNSRFFHQSASARRKKNRVVRLKNDEGI